MVTAVDSCVLFDIIKNDELYYPKSYDNLNNAIVMGRIIICEVAVSEIASEFQSHDKLDYFLADLKIEVVASSTEALLLASKCFKNYLARRILQCPDCGSKFQVVCPRCGVNINIRQRILSDFIIGAHALIHADCLLTRDNGYYNTYYPELVIK